MAADRHVIATVIHHVAFDGWSAGIFLAEFTKLYTAFTEQRPDPLPPLAIEYADYALWQRDQSWDTDLAYWIEELEDAPARLELPTDALPQAATTRFPAPCLSSWNRRCTLNF